MMRGAVSRPDLITAFKTCIEARIDELLPGYHSMVDDPDLPLDAKRMALNKVSRRYPLIKKREEFQGMVNSIGP